MRRSLLPLLLLTACSPHAIIAEQGEISEEEGSVDTSPLTGEDADGDGEPDDTTGDEQAALDAQWDGARLEILSPRSGDFLPWQEGSSFQAVVYDAAGNETDFAEIAWTSDADGSWSAEGASFEDDDLDVGEHALTAEALLPNGDRLAYTVGGLLVQHEDAGTYVGDVQVDLAVTYEETEYSAGCSGSATLVVDAYGETAVGESACTLSLMGQETTTTYAFDLALADGAVSGETAMDLSIVTYDMDVAGEVGSGALSGAWADDIYGFVGVVGEMSLTRVSRDVELESE